MTSLTNLEKVLIPELISSTFNSDYLDFDKNWEDQNLEDDAHFESIVDARYYAKETKLSVATVKGLLGSLTKKGFITVVDDIDPDDKPMSWLWINEEQFNKLKQEFNNS